MRLIAASIVVALAAALLGFCGGGIALATTAGSPGGAVLGGILPGGPAATTQPDCHCVSAPAPTATCQCLRPATPVPTCTTCVSTPAPTPTCTCMRTTTPTPTPTPTMTPTPRHTSTPRHTPTPTATCTGLPTVTPAVTPEGAPAAGAPQRADPAPVCSTAPVPFHPPGAAKSSVILPVTGADIMPLVAVAALFLAVGAVAFIAGRTGR